MQREWEGSNMMEETWEKGGRDTVGSGRRLAAYKKEKPGEWLDPLSYKKVLLVEEAEYQRE